MRRLFSRFIFLAFFHPAAIADNFISVQTLNTYYPFYASGKLQRKSSLFKLLQKETSDINFFQEVWLKRFHIDMKNWSQLLGMKSIVYDTLKKNSKWSGLVTLLKGDVHKKEIHFFPIGEDLYDYLYSIFDINKGFGIAYITHPKFPNTPLWVVNTHLHHVTQKTRLLQLIHYFKWFLNPAVLQDPVICAGDFNFEPDSLEFKIIQNMFLFKEPQSYLGMEYSCTLCKDNEYSISHTLSEYLSVDYEKTTDYIFFRSSPYVRLIPKNFHIFPKKYNGHFVSDHYGLKVDIELQRDSSHQKAVVSKELERRIKNFSQTLDEAQSLLGQDFVSEQAFLNSLRGQLKDSDSPLMRHLKQQ